MISQKRNDLPTRSLSSPPPLDTSIAIGTWRNTRADTGEIAALRITARGAGLALRAFGAGAQGEHDWGEQEAALYADATDSETLLGFRADFDLGYAVVELAANLKLGILVIQSYTRYQDESGRGSYLNREFFHRIDRPAPGPLPVAAPGLGWATAGDLGVAPDGDRVDMSTYLGDWRNVYEHSRAIPRFTVTEGEGGYIMTLYGPDGRALGTTVALPHAARPDTVPARGFWGTVDLGFKDLRVAVNDNQGILILACYSTFKDGSGRKNYFSREFYFLSSRGTAP